MKRSGTADLPLHGGHVPRWLADRMTEMGRAVVEVIVSEYGKSEFLSRLSDPFWFQALGAVMGMDWHSSGITTSVLGALKRGLNPISHETGIYVCGGRGRHSRKTPDELVEVADRLSLDGRKLVRASKLSAKVDNTCLLDGFGLYLHSFILTDEGEWVVVQQGMNNENHMARRYHWHSASVKSFTLDPRTAVVGRNVGAITNLSDGRSEPAQHGIVTFLSQHPDKQLGEMRRLVMPSRHDVRPIDVDSKRLGVVLALAYEKQFKTFADALLLEGVGPRTMQSLALVGEVIFGAPSRFEDPARFAFAHGGKDGHPFPVPLKVYDESIGILKKAVNQAKVGHSERVKGLKKLSQLSYLIEKNYSPQANVSEVIRKERAESWRHGGMTVKGPSRPQKTPQESTWYQPDLF